MNNIEIQYLEALQYILDKGTRVQNRTGIDTLSVFAVNLRHDLSEGFPAFTTRKLAFKSMFHELIWLIRGDSNIRYLQENGIKIWDHWADEEGNIGPSYPFQWRHFPKPDGGEVDQLADIITSLRENPTSRRQILCAWNPGMTEQMILPPCHAFVNFYADDGRVNCHLTQRSGDMPVGIYFNVASYSLLTHLIAKIVGKPPGVFHHTIVNAHIYVDQIEGVKELLLREPKKFPALWVDPNLSDINEVTIDSARLVDYDYCKPQIKFPVAV